MSKGHVLVGITGGIAAYKTLFLIRLLVRGGYEVKTVTTEHALKFITPLTIETLSDNPLYCDLFTLSEERNIKHISLYKWADVCVVAPATANCIGKLASGIADDLLSTTLLAFKKPLFLAPSMNENMFLHFSTQKNLEFLKKNGIKIIEPAEGFLSCKTQGKGRMAEPEDLFNIIDNFFNKKNCHTKLEALVTAGPTYEPIDPVRFIGNRSSGKMGYCLAEALANKGANVELVSGPSVLNCNHPNVHLTKVETSEEMYRTCAEKVEKADLVIMSAAVADWRPENPCIHKIKKTEEDFQINLRPTTDILKTLASKKRKNQIFIGFALETDNEEANALRKMESKNADMIVLNSLKDEGAGFNIPTNKVTLITKNGIIKHLPLLSKEETAECILEEIFEHLMPDK